MHISSEVEQRPDLNRTDVGSKVTIQQQTFIKSSFIYKVLTFRELQ